MSELVQLGAGTLSSAPVALSGPLVDQFGRTHDNLRISVTDHCNIRCFYCMAEDASDFVPAAKQLSFGQITHFVKLACALGIRKLRLTGGEPLLRPKIPELIESLTRVGLDEIALTTNAVLLDRMASPLYEAGLRRLNVHIDTLDRERYIRFARRDDLGKALAGIDAAQQAGFRSIKLNAVAIRGLSEPDIIPLARFARERGFEIRFIEFMPLDAQDLWSRTQVLTADEILSMLTAEFGPLTVVPDADPRAPATEYEYVDGKGRVGLIASVSKPFCLNCNRLRLTADGYLRYCLFAREETAVSHLLDGQHDTELEMALRTTVWQKWVGHQINSTQFSAPQRPMYSIGG